MNDKTQSISSLQDIYKVIVKISISIALAISFSVNFSYAREFEIGIGTHISYYPENSNYYIELVKKYGFTSIRDELPWTNVDNGDGTYAIPKYRKKNDDLFNNSQNIGGISSMLVLDYGHLKYTGGGYPQDEKDINQFVQYASWIANRYKGKVKYYEIWNEWLLGTGIKPRLQKYRPSDDIYFKLVKETSQAIRKIDPNAIIVTGSFNPNNEKDKEWILGLLDSGLMDYIDGLSLHPYTYNTGSSVKESAEGNLDIIDAFSNELKQKYHKTIPLYITEIGVPTYKGRWGVTEEKAALFAMKYTLMAKSREYIKGIWWYDLKDDGNDENNKEHRFGFFTNAFQEKKAATLFLENKSVIDQCLIQEIKNNIKAQLVCGGDVNTISLEDRVFLSKMRSNSN
ncbi:cellulase family glycosylhydrolase [Klebsiella michiganensis]|uniref:cellulase family glycosylhydrolase n=1 Tax=Klebsiella michiganensis TaxID=1134687 RepID=UPI00177D6106|nr:cellulase family glycosylhydrolase [Klebsiella michiganensis]ELI8802186.1 cellulase family glycosylhydrolase [Klebsiella michiganensis]MBE0155462.1 glycoside hydrolase family 5 protein [Klebsiella michiganensis]MBE0169823.1 glycoside hydrolase family 5 protein [Klebsiella michiganensis]MBE0189749.1 glycoside hydrolase family 5 protein [Klebsiella michiganensis]MBE0217787.1 glycoside hydrolase family 5 protein [Klebsiella michiganensis]